MCSEVSVLRQTIGDSEQTFMKNKREELELQREELQRHVTKDRDRLRKLKLVKMYRTKNDLSELQGLIDKWRTACKMAIEELYHMTPEPRPALAELIADWRVDPDLIKFDIEADSFT